MEISYLFQKVKEHSGMAILTTNLRANPDESFAHLIHYSWSLRSLTKRIANAYGKTS
jgi:hypothetical protein